VPAATDVVGANVAATLVATPPCVVAAGVVVCDGALFVVVSGVVLGDAIAVVTEETLSDVGPGVVVAVELVGPDFLVCVSFL